MKTRNRLVHDNYLAKPAFAFHLMEMNKMVYDLQLTKTISGSLGSNTKIWEVEDFKGEMKKARNDATKHYDNVVERMIAMMETCCKEVVERTTLKESAEVEENRFSKQIKQKAMNVIRKEKEERIRHLELARRDKGKLRNFVRLVDYMITETLVKTNLISMENLLEEIQKEGRKSGGLFNSTVIFDQNILVFSPDERDISETLMTILEVNIFIIFMLLIY